MQRPVETQLGDPLERRVHPLLREDVQQLVAQAGGGEVADQPRLDRAARQRQRVAVHAEAEPRLVADRPQQARRVLDEAEVVQHPHGLLAQVAEAAEEVVGGAQVLGLAARSPSR